MTAFRPKSIKTWLLVAAAVWVALIGIFALIAIPALRATAVRELKKKTVTLPFNRVQSGAHQVVVWDLELLAKLASDPTCIKNLVEIRFSGVTFGPNDGDRLSKLIGLQKISFYECRNVDSAFFEGVNLEVQSVHFEVVDISREALTRMWSYPSLQSVEFEQVPSDEQRIALKGFPRSVVVRFAN